MPNQKPPPNPNHRRPILSALVINKLTPTHMNSFLFRLRPVLFAAIVACIAKLSATAAPDFTAPLTRDNAVVLFIDNQTNLIAACQSIETHLLINNTVGLAKIAKLYGLPVALTTTGGGGSGPAGPLIPGITETFPDAPIIDRQGFFNSMSDPAFRKAVEATKRKKLIITGITTDYCVMLPALTALREGYTVYVVTDTCGSWTPAIEQAAWQRLSQAGAILTNMQALVAELQNNLMLADPVAAKAKQRDMIAFFGTYVGPTALMNATFMPKLAAPKK